MALHVLDDLVLTEFNSSFKPSDLQAFASRREYPAMGEERGTVSAPEADVMQVGPCGNGRALLVSAYSPLQDIGIDQRPERRLFVRASSKRELRQLDELSLLALMQDQKPRHYDVRDRGTWEVHLRTTINL